jgi:hypothetical protein
VYVEGGARNLHQPPFRAWLVVDGKTIVVELAAKETAQSAARKIAASLPKGYTAQIGGSTSPRGKVEIVILRDA